MESVTNAAGHRFRAAREIRGLSQRALGEETGFDQAYISRVERGLERPSVDFLVRVGRALGLRELVAQVEKFWKPSPKPNRRADE
jgi:transcriptional regulator with XRE-family HTH domain